MVTTAVKTSKETGVRLLCAKHDGSKGAKFEAWKKLYIDAAYGEGAWGRNLAAQAHMGLTMSSVSRGR